MLADYVPMLENGMFWALFADIVRQHGAAARYLARRLLSEDIPAPPSFRPQLRVKVATSDAPPRACVAELAAAADVTVPSLAPSSEFTEWMGARVLDPAAWRARAYFALKLPLAAVGPAVIAAGWLAVLAFLDEG